MGTPRVRGVTSLAPRTGPLARGLPLDAVWVGLALLLPAIAAMLAEVLTIDLAYHVRAGDLMLDRGSILRQAGPFSFVDPDAPWLNQQWGAQVVLALVHRIGGFPALALLRAAGASATAGLVYFACRARGADRRGAAAMAIVGLTIAFPALGVRPQLFGLVLFALTIWLLVDGDRHPGRLWALPVVAVVWANVHGSFVLLPVLVVLAIADRGRRDRAAALRLAAIGLASVAATGIGPFGYRVWSYAADVSTDPAVRDLVTEWGPPTLRDAEGWLLFASAIAAAALLARRGGTPGSDLLWLGVFFVAALATARGVAWWGLVLAVVLAPRLPRASNRTRSPANVAILAVLVVALLAVMPWRGVRLAYAPDPLVMAAADATAPGDRLFVFQSWASWFEYRLPDRPVFADSRIELFPAAVWRQYHAVAAGRADWPSVLDRWDVDAVVAPPDWQLLRFLGSDPGWRLVHRDGTGQVFVRA